MIRPTHGAFGMRQIGAESCATARSRRNSRCERRPWGSAFRPNNGYDYFRRPMSYETANSGQRTTVELSESELAAIVGALNEVCNGIQIADFEFHVRMGIERKDARASLERVRSVLDQSR